MDARDAAALRAWIDEAQVSGAVAQRARIVLLASEGRGTTAIADALACSKQTVITWRERFRSVGIVGLQDAPRSGRPMAVAATVVIKRTLDPPPPAATRWTTRLLGTELGVSNVAVGAVWRGWGVSPRRAGGVLLSTAPVLDDRISAVVGIHVSTALRLIALITDSRPAATAIPVSRRPDPGERLSEITSALRAPQCGPDPLDATLERLDDHANGSGPTTLRLIVDEPGDRVRQWADDRHEVLLHVVPPELSWARLARVSCLLAGAARQGAESVDALDAALRDHPEGATLSWAHA